MKVYYFSEFPYHEYPDEEGDKYPSLRLTFPNTYFDPEKGHQLFQRGFASQVRARIASRTASGVDATALQPRVLS